MKAVRITCSRCSGTGWMDMPEHDDGSPCQEICTECKGFGFRARTEEEKRAAEARVRAELEKAGALNKVFTEFLFGGRR